MAKTKGVKYWSNKLIGNGGILNEFVKYNHAVDFTELGKPICVCVTCSKIVSGVNLHAGHWQSRRHKAVAYDEKNLHPQCANCNKWLNGNYPRYEDYILKTYGEEERDRLRQGAYKVKKWTPEELEDMYYFYKKKVREIKDYHE